MLQKKSKPFGVILETWNKLSLDSRDKIAHKKYSEGEAIALKMPASNYSEEGGEFTITFVAKDEVEEYPEGFVIKGDVKLKDYPEVVKGEFIRNIYEVEELLKSPKCVGSAREKAFFGIEYENKMYVPSP